MIVFNPDHQWRVSWMHGCRIHFRTMLFRIYHRKLRQGRRSIGHATVVKVIWFVLTGGIRWKDVPREIRSNRRHTWPTPFESDNALCRCRMRPRRYSLHPENFRDHTVHPTPGTALSSPPSPSESSTTPHNKIRMESVFCQSLKVRIRKTQAACGNSQ